MIPLFMPRRKMDVHSALIIALPVVIRPICMDVGGRPSADSAAAWRPLGPGALAIKKYAMWSDFPPIPTGSKVGKKFKKSY
jgi:hypothetical protein